MSKRIPLYAVILILAASILLSFLSGFAVSSSVFLDKIYDIYQGNADTGSNDKLDLIVDLFKTYSFYEVDEEALCRALLDGMPIAIEDRYAEYYDAEQYAQMTASNKGEGCGVGISVIENVEHKCIEVNSIFEGAPAEKAGILPGDLIVYIGNGDDVQYVSELGYYIALDMLRGEKGTEAKFGVVRDGNFDAPIEFSIVRDEYTASSVTYHICETDASVGIVKLIEFNLTTPTQFCAAMDALIEAGAEKFIFDVRYNGGGDLASITAVLSYMLREGDTVIKTVTGDGTESVTKVSEVSYSAAGYESCNIKKDDIGKYRDYVLGKSAVLANGSTASAAELFTAALSDYEISTVVGTLTYGKGSMQTIFALAQFGYDGAVKMTTKKYFPPISEGYDGIGITPDVEVELDEALQNKNIYKITDEEDNQLQTAIASIGK